MATKSLCAAPRRDKRPLRRTLLAQRRAHTPEERIATAHALQAALANLNWLQHAQCVGVYRPIRGELPLDALELRWREAGRTLVYPRCEGRALCFAPASTDPSDWTPGAFGIPEPRAAAISPDEIDALLVPAVACDLAGYRLGYGGGFYDRFLTRHPELVPRTIAIVDEAGFIDTAPRDPWDVALAYIATPRGVFKAAATGSDPSTVTGASPSTDDDDPLTKGEIHRA